VTVTADRAAENPGDLALVVGRRAIFDCHVRKTATASLMKSGIKRWSCTVRWQSDITRRTSPSLRRCEGCCNVIVCLDALTYKP
jgi:hypothetical protein